MPNFYWNDSLSTGPARTTTFFNGAANITNSVANVPLGRAGYRVANDIFDTNAAIYIRSAKMYLAGYGSATTCTIKVGTATSSSFSVNSASTTLVEPRAYDVGLKTVDYKVGAGTTSIAMGFTSTSAVFFGRYGTTADSTTLWGYCDYDQVPTAPQVPNSTNITSSGFTANWSAPSDNGGSAVNTYVVQISTASNFSSKTTYTTASTNYPFTDLSGSTTYYVRIFAGNDIYTDFSSQTASAASTTLTVTTLSATPAPVFSDGVYNYSTLYVGDYVNDYIQASDTTSYSLVTAPAGLSLTDFGSYVRLTGYISPQSSASGTITVRATGPGGATDSSDVFLIRQAAPQWTDTTVTSTGTVATYYSSTFAATDAVSWSITGTLPPGLSTSGTSGATVTVSGTPTTAGTYTFYAQPSNSEGLLGVNQSFTITISGRTPVWSDQTLDTAARVGLSYSSTVSASYVSYWTDGTLPTNGLSFTGGTNVSGLATGTVSGTPTNYGTTSFTLTPYSSDGQTPGGVAFGITVYDASITWSDQLLTSSIAAQDVAYSDGVSVASGPISVTYAVVDGALPTGVTLNTSTGAISGTPTVPGTYTFILSATNGSNEVIYTDSLSITVEAAGGYVKVKSGGTWVDGTAYIKTAGGWVEATVNVKGPGGWGASFTS